MSLGEKVNGKRIYLATAEALDEEMRERIQSHQKERGGRWNTIEEPIKLAETLAEQEGKSDVVIIDCLTLWTCNLMMKDKDRKSILCMAKELIAQCKKINGHIFLITNEVGAGIVPEGKLSRDFRDLAGEANQMMAESFDEVVHMVSGIPTYIKKSLWEDSASEKKETHEFSQSKKEGLYEAIYKRRDVRQFSSKPVPPNTLSKVLQAAHHAGSVGFMQPWNFIVVDDSDVKAKVAENFMQSNLKAKKRFKGERLSLYESLKLEGITEAPINICVTCDSFRKGPHVLGRNTMPETDVYSACCAIQNLWLAARVEGLAVGWVSILSPERLKIDLGIPEHIKVVAYLCVGYTDSFYEKPLLELSGWERRSSLEELVFYNNWEGKPSGFRMDFSMEVNSKRVH